MTDGIIRAAGTSGGIAAAADDEFGEEGMQCSNHPYRNNASSGGICALCLQEKLGKLVSSSFFNVASSSSSSPSFRSDPSAAANAASLSLTLSLRPAASVVSSSSSTNGQNHGYCSSTKKSSTTRRARIPFLLPHKKKKATADQNPSNPVLKRSKSAVFPRRRPSAAEDYSNAAQKRWGFWSFLYHSKPKPERPSSSASSSARDLKAAAQAAPAAAVQAPPAASSSKRAEYLVVADESVDSPSSGSSNATSFGRKVSRSRSVGCGSRSFSGDFFERITTGFGDCTLRRVESQREGKRRSSGDVIKEKVRCGGIFSGFMMTSSSSSSSDRLSAGDQEHQVSGKGSTTAPPALHGRSKSWRWALASPMRAFGRPSPSSSAKELKTSASKSNATTPNLTAIPSLLTVR